MLVRFESDVGSLTMFGDIAVKLLKMMGHSGTVPSALLAEDIPPALARLKGALEREEPAAGERRADKGDDGEKPVSLHGRAHPLIALLERAAREDCEVVWR
jgi:hypothetical protein